MAEQFDAIIVGTGQAGVPLAHRLAGAKMRVAIVERGKFGGTCVNTGCIPTKAMAASAYAAAHGATGSRIRDQRRRHFHGNKSGHESSEGAQGPDFLAVSNSSRIGAKESGRLHGLRGPRAI